MKRQMFSTLARRARQAPLATETLVAYARARWRMAREPDVRKLLLAARRGQMDCARADSRPDAQDLARMVSLTLGRLPTDSRCLVRSLVLIELLARRGIEARLVIGTSAATDFSAHAWVELGGEALLPPAGFARGRLAEL